MSREELTQDALASEITRVGSERLRKPAVIGLTPPHAGLHAVGPVAEETQPFQDNFLAANPSVSSVETMQPDSEQSALRLGRMFAALSATNEAMLRAGSPEELYQEVCDAAVFGGRFLSATVLLVPVDGVWATVAATTRARAGDLQGRIAIDATLPEGRGLVGTAVQTRLPCISNDYVNDPRTLPWHAMARENGVAAGAALPLLKDDRVPGVLLLFLAEKDGFDGELIAWLQRLAANIVHALDRFERDRQFALTDDALRESEARFRGLVELSSDGYWQQDAEFRFVRFEGRHVADETNPASALIGRCFWDLPGIIPGSADVDRLRAAMLSREPFRELEYSFRDPQGHVRYVSVTGEPLANADGQCTGYRGTSRDVTRRKRAEALIALEHAVTRNLAEAETSRKVLQAVMRVICESEQWETGGYFRVEDALGTTRLIVGWNGPGTQQATIDFYKGTTDRVIPPGGLLSRVVAAAQPIWIADMNETQTTWRQRVKGTNAHATFSCPVWAEGKVIGVLAFSSSSIREPDDMLLRTVRIIGEQVGQFLRRKEAEQVVRESEARFRALTKLSSDWYWETDAEDRYIRLEGRYVEAGEVPVGMDAIGKRRWETGLEVDGGPPGDQGWDAHRRQLAAHEPFQELVLRRDYPDGSCRYISVSGEPVVDHRGQFIGYRGIGQDVTRRKRDESELRRHRDHLQELVAEQTGDLRRAKEEAESANRAKTEFLSNMSHELRTPMHAILSFTDLGVSRGAKGTLALEKAVEYFDRVHQSAKRLMHLLTALLDFAKLDEGKAQYSMAETDISVVVKTIASEFDALAASRRVRVHLDAGVVPTVQCDSLRIGQVIRNVISNALKWTPTSGSIHIVVAIAQRRMHPDSDIGAGTNGVHIAVADTGPGIPEEELDRIFEKFVQSSRTKTGAGGTGLGLAISRKIVEDHGGRLWAENSPDGGATIHCLLPLLCRPLPDDRAQLASDVTK